MRTASKSFKVFASVALIIMAIVLTTVSMSEAWGGGRFHGGPRVFVGIGPPAVVVAPYPWWYYRPAYYYPPYYYPPPVIVQEPTVYVQQPPAAPPPPAPPAPPSASAEAYWYYCESARAYYPTVQSCPEAWIKVPPRAQ